MRRRVSIRADERVSVGFQRAIRDQPCHHKLELPRCGQSRLSILRSRSNEWSAPEILSPALALTRLYLFINGSAVLLRVALLIHRRADILPRRVLLTI